MGIISITKKQVNKAFNFFGYEINRIKEPTHTIQARIHEIKILLYFKNLLGLVNSVDGDVVECGVGTGKTFYFLCALTALDQKKRNVWGFDSFEGFPEPSIEDTSPRAPQKGEWKDQTIKIDDVSKMLLEGGISAEFVKERVNLVKGFFSESLPHFTGERIALLHLDVDLYESYKQTLEYFWPKVSMGGVVLFDEYKQPGVEDVFPGAAKAIDNFFGERKRLIQYDAGMKRYYIVKDNE